MTAATIIVRSVGYYWRTHLGVVLGTALGAMVLIGALLVGDSVKATLKHQALLRVGKADAALVSGDRFFREQLAEKWEPDLTMAADVILPGMIDEEKVITFEIDTDVEVFA